MYRSRGPKLCTDGNRSRFVPEKWYTSFEWDKVIEYGLLSEVDVGYPKTVSQKQKMIPSSNTTVIHTPFVSN